MKRALLVSMLLATACQGPRLIESRSQRCERACEAAGLRFHEVDRGRCGCDTSVRYIDLPEEGR